MDSWIVTAQKAVRRSPVVREELRAEAEELLRAGEREAAQRIFNDILEEPMPGKVPAVPQEVIMSNVAQPQIDHDPETMYVHFADLSCQPGLEVASNFVVYFGPSGEIAGLEILWDETNRADSEPALLAFGVFASAVVWRDYHHEEHKSDKMRGAVLRKVKELVSAANLPMQASYSGSTGLAIRNESGKLLLSRRFAVLPRARAQLRKQRRSQIACGTAEGRDCKNPLGHRESRRNDFAQQPRRSRRGSIRRSDWPVDGL